VRLPSDIYIFSQKTRTDFATYSHTEHFNAHVEDLPGIAFETYGVHKIMAVKRILSMRQQVVSACSACVGHFLAHTRHA
jgi:hypothetical protein